MMHEKSLLMYWADKGNNATTISAKMEGYFGSSTLSYAWLTKWLRALKRDGNISNRVSALADPKIHYLT
jgi:hypothetical protein